MLWEIGVLAGKILPFLRGALPVQPLSTLPVAQPNIQATTDPFCPSYLLVAWRLALYSIH